MAKRSSSSRFIGTIAYFLLQLFLVLAIIAFVPGLPPYEDFSYYKLDIPPLTTNTKLNNAELLFLNEIKGPEDFAVHKNELYTGAHGGYVLKVLNGKLVPVIKFGKDCEGFHDEETCGRPLCLEFDSKGYLYVADAYYGIMKVNTTTGAVNVLASIEEPIDGVLPKIPNSIALSKKTSDFYWTDSSTTHQLKNGLFTVLSNGDGRVIKYNAAKGKNEVLLKGLHFANGIALSKDESFLVISETMRGRLIRYNLKGPKVGQTEIFAILPGFPDNIKIVDGKFAVSLVAKPDTALKVLAEWPVIRRLISRIGVLVDSIISFTESVYPNSSLRIAAHWLGHFESFNVISKPHFATVCFLNEDGKIVETLTADDNKIHSISSVISYQGYYYLGSPYNNYIARVKIYK